MQLHYFRRIDVCGWFLCSHIPSVPAVHYTGELKSFSHEEERGEEADDMEEDKGGVEAEVAMYRQLQVVDPVGAARLHPNDTRRVRA